MEQQQPLYPYLFQQNNQPVLLPITTYTKTYIKTFDYITVSISNVKLGESANILVAFYDTNKKVQDYQTLILTGTDYTNWGHDDLYITNYVYNHLGVTPLAPAT
jgi:hypothetical protein